jgi:hypothetical protein
MAVGRGLIWSGLVFERCVHGSLWRCRVREISMDILVTSTKFFPSLTDAKTDAWNHCLGPSDEIKSS